jgi:hypothetical protein
MFGGFQSAAPCNNPNLDLGPHFPLRKKDVFNRPNLSQFTGQQFGFGVRFESCAVDIHMRA